MALHSSQVRDSDIWLLMFVGN